MTRFALVDIGSNTVRMNICDVEPDEKKSILLFSRKETLGLINYIDNACMTEDGIRKLIETLRNFKMCAESVSCERFVCFATACMRGISNREDIVFQISNALGISIDIISGEDEALYGFYGLQKHFNVSDGLMVDTGGGSVEFLRFYDGKPIKSASEPIGSLALFTKYCSKLLPKNDELEAMTKYIDKKLNGVSWLNTPFQSAFFIGGTARTIAKMHKAINKGKIKDGDNNNSDSGVNGFKIKKDDVFALYDYYREDKKNFVTELIKESPDRVHTFVPGLLIYTRILKIIASDFVTISSFGVREGYLISKIMY